MNLHDLNGVDGKLYIIQVPAGRFISITQQVPAGCLYYTFTLPLLHITLLVMSDMNIARGGNSKYCTGRTNLKHL